ncbi:MAG: hypothetical protein ABGY11_01830 [Candidatus Thioglobus sp.]
MKRQIGWQKYEALLEEQMSSTLIMDLLKSPVDEEEMAYREDDEDVEDVDSLMIPISSKLVEDAMMITNFDCWLGHTNFDITPDVKAALDKTEGVELLKVMSRYRFFIGVGKMFEFAKVRKRIETELTKEMINEEEEQG